MSCCGKSPRLGVKAGAFVEWAALFRNPDLSPTDLTGSTFVAELWTDTDPSVVAGAWTVTLSGLGDVALKLDTTATPLLSGIYRYTLWVTLPSGRRNAYFEDSVLTVRP
jgi:hypothetical protein